jgi:hypothetical protein
VVQFPGSRGNGEIAAAVADLVQRGIIRVLDLLILKKDTDGSLDAFELADLNDEIGDLNDRCGGDVGAPCSAGSYPTRIWDRSSAKVTSRIQCRRFSTCQCSRMAPANWSGRICCQHRWVTA